MMISEELRRQKDEALSNLKVTAEKQCRQLAQEIRTDKEDDMQTDFEQIRQQMELSLRH